jgi:exopolysaccharide biosynthesis polyprenyl glycosylphosphotransferase
MSVRYSKYLPVFTFISDLLLLNLSLYTADFLTHNAFLQGIDVQFILLFNMAWVTTSVMTKCFEISRPLWLRTHINVFLMSMAYHLICLFGIIYFFTTYLTYLPELLMFYALFFLFILVQRSIMFFFLDYIRKKGYNNRQIIIIGDKNIAERLIDSFLHHLEYGYDLADLITEEEMTGMAEDVLIEKLLSKRPDEIFVCYKQLHNDLLQRLISFGDDNFIKIKVVSDLILNNSYAQLVNYNNVPVLHLTSHPEISLKIRLIKRLFDLLFSITAMIIGAPIFFMLYLITKISSAGPVFYKQERIGMNGKPFYIYKFRSMRMDAEKNGPQLSRSDDPRSTKWGRIMRKTRLDELPQFWNVLKGEMSVVGPRPERQYFIEKIAARAPSYKKLLRIKPGLTSVGQVQYGYAENIDQMCDRMQHDLLYLKNININYDLNIILKTVKIMVQGKGK